MAISRQQAEKYLQNPNVVKALNAVAAAEGANYNTIFGGQTVSDLSKHPNITKYYKGKPTTAAGRYQFIKGTWDDAAKSLGLKDFGQRSQDLAAIYLFDKQGVLNDIASGNITGKTLVGLGKEWASVPGSTYGQPVRSLEFMSRQLGIPVEKLRQGFNGRAAADTGGARGTTTPVAQAPQNVNYEDNPLVPQFTNPYESLMEGFKELENVANTPIDTSDEAVPEMASTGTDQLKQYFPTMDENGYDNAIMDKMYDMALAADNESARNAAVSSFVKGQESADYPQALHMDENVRRELNRIVNSVLG